MKIRSIENNVADSLAESDLNADSEEKMDS